MRILENVINVQSEHVAPSNMGVGKQVAGTDFRRTKQVAGTNKKLHKPTINGYNSIEN